LAFIAAHRRILECSFCRLCDAVSHLRRASACLCLRQNRQHDQWAIQNRRPRIWGKKWPNFSLPYCPSLANRSPSAVSLTGHGLNICML